MLDIVEILVMAGDGGAGAVSFRRERYVPRGGPDGGDGGRGGNVVLQADRSVENFGSFWRKRVLRAENGQNGSGGQRHGKDGEDLVIRVPLGTRVYKEDRGEEVFTELDRDGQRLVVARGGKGGKGNKQFATAVNQTPRFAEQGEKREEAKVRLELRLLADVGLIGLSNAGKSTLLRACTAAHPGVGPFLFTTTEPQLGVMSLGYKRLVAADIPGLVQGAHAGKGLGDQFLKHIQRTRVIVHVVSGESKSPQEDVWLVDEEMRKYDPALAERQQLLAINKIDLAEVRAKIGDIRDALSSLGRPLFFISASTGEGVEQLVEHIFEVVEEQRTREGGDDSAKPLAVFRPEPRRQREVLLGPDGAYVLTGRDIPELVLPRELSREERAGILRERLRWAGWGRLLEKAGVCPGDTIQVGDMRIEW